MCICSIHTLYAHILQFWFSKSCNVVFVMSCSESYESLLLVAPLQLSCDNLHEASRSSIEYHRDGLLNACAYRSWPHETIHQA